MITLTRLHGAGSIVVNADLIETIEACPDTTVTLLTKRRFVVVDPLDEVIAKVVAFRHACAGGTPASVRMAVHVREQQSDEAA